MQPNPAATPRGPKGEVRPIFKLFLLVFVTFGIYGIIWQSKMADEINAFLGYNRTSFWKMMLLTSVTCGLYGFYYMFVDAPKMIKEVQAKAGLPENAPFVAGPYQIQGALNKVWEALPA